MSLVKGFLTAPLAYFFFYLFPLDPCRGRSLPTHPLGLASLRDQPHTSTTDSKEEKNRASHENKMRRPGQQDLFRRLTVVMDLVWLEL